MTKISVINVKCTMVSIWLKGSIETVYSSQIFEIHLFNTVIETESVLII